MNEAAPLFATPRLVARPLRADQVPALQALFDANPGYFQAVNGRPPKPDEAQLEFDERPPPHLGWTRRWCAGLFDASSALQGVLVVVADLGTAGAWHIALLLLADALHGSGAAAEVHAALEDFMRAGGARWARLGVVAGNARAERFWQRLGYRELRRREGVDTGGRVNTLRVLLKPLRPDAGIDDYLARVPRDRPDADLP